MKYIALFFLLHTGTSYSQWQVIPPTDGKWTYSILISDDFLFASYGSNQVNTNSAGFVRLDLANGYQEQLMVDNTGQVYPINSIGYLCEVDGPMFALNGLDVISSNDSGNTWVDTYTLFTSNNNPMRLLGDTSSSQLYMGANLSIFRSVNFGTTFTSIYHENFYVNTSMKPLMAHNGLLYTSEARGLLLNNAPVSDLEFNQMTRIGNTKYAMYYFDLYKSTDIGTNWSLVSSSPLNNAYVSDFKAYDGVLYACTYEGLLASVDNGLNFIDITGNLPNLIYELEFRDNEVYVASEMGVYVRSISEILANLGEPVGASASAKQIIYPNPSSGTFNMHGVENGSITIFDGLGREIQFVQTAFNNGLSITLSAPYHGICFVHYLDDQNRIIVQKVVIQD